MAGVLTPEDRRLIQRAVEDRLRRSGNPIMTTPARLDQLRAQVAGVLDDLDEIEDAGWPDQASAVIPPMESLEAAEILFAATLEVLQPAGTAAALTMRLHRAVTERFSRSAAFHVNTLLLQVRSAEQAERKRLARELRDQAAHRVGAALESLELLDRADVRTDPSRAAARLSDARVAMHDALGTIRTIATELRDSLGERELSEAVATYLARFAPPTLSAEVTVAGDLSTVPPPIAQELYLMVREAVHNTVLHASARWVRVRLERAPGAVSASVHDDGIGFDRTLVHGSGLASLRERLELLGGTLVLTGEPGRGSMVAATIPLS